MTDWTDAEIRRLKRSNPSRVIVVKGKEVNLDRIARLKRIRQNVALSPSKGFWADDRH